MTRKHHGGLSRIWEGDEESDTSLRQQHFDDEEDEGRDDSVSSESSLFDEDMLTSFYPA